MAGLLAQFIYVLYQTIYISTQEQIFHYNLKAIYDSITFFIIINKSHVVPTIKCSRVKINAGKGTLWSVGT